MDEIKEAETGTELEIMKAKLTELEEGVVPAEVIKEPEKPLSPIGITKASHEESKKRKRMAKESRRRNRRK